MTYHPYITRVLRQSYPRSNYPYITYYVMSFSSKAKITSSTIESPFKNCDLLIN